MTLELDSPAADDTQQRDAREQLLRTISASVFVLFFQTYMVAPLIPSLAVALNASRERVGFLIPAYTLPYAAAAMVCGTLSDRLGRRGVLLFSLAAFPVAGFAMAAAPSLDWLLVLRGVSGALNVGVIVVGLSLVVDLFPKNERGRAIGWVFGAIAGGGAFGSTGGGLLAPLVGWRGLFVLVAVAGAALFVRGLRILNRLRITGAPAHADSVGQVVRAFADLLRQRRGWTTFLFIFLNAVFHGALFTWLGVYLHDRFGLGDIGIGLALLGYGVPGLVLGPTIGRLVDRHGRRFFIPAGIATAALSAAALAPPVPLVVAALAVTILSLGFDMSHPLLAGIASSLDDRRRGQAIGMNGFAIFAGFGVGSLVFGALCRHDMTATLGGFAVVQFALAAFALVALRRE